MGDDLFLLDSILLETKGARVWLQNRKFWEHFYFMKLIFIREI